jgi:ribonuclease HI
MEDYLTIYTDGSSAPHPRKGGVGFRIIFPTGRYKDFCPQGYLGATNNEMELQACVLALREVVKLKDLENAKGIIVYTDSQYVVSNYGNAMFSWPKQKWTRNNREPVLNTSQWKELIRLMKRIGYTFRIQVSFEKVEAHAGIADNEAVDKLAKASRKGIPGATKISVSVVRKSKTDKKTIRGSIHGEGQRIRIRAVSTNWLATHKLYRARCEVISKRSKYFGNMDFILSESILRAGHVYDVILMKDLDHCRTKKVIREIEK